MAERTLRAHLRHTGLTSFVAELRLARRRARENQLRKLVVRHRGQVTAVARSLGVGQSTADHAVRKAGLFPLVRALRPAKPRAAEEKAKIRAALREHNGQLVDVQSALGISKGTLRSRMRRYRLFAEADALRIQANLIGPRTHLPRNWNRNARRKRLIAILESCDWRVARACKLAGISVSTFYVRMHDLGIERPRVRPQDRKRQIVDALRLARGSAMRAARILGVSERTLLNWCREFDIVPLEYRQH